MEAITKFPKIMGILNITPDSFSDGGKYFSEQAALERALEMIDEGADIIDIGAESTRPGSDPVPADKEAERILPVLEAIRKVNKDIIISIDTTKALIAELTLKAGANIINDISGLDFEPKIAEIVAAKNATLAIMHIKGSPKTMQDNPIYEDVTQEVYDKLEAKCRFAKSFGVENIIVDVGIGFGKSLDDNLSLLKHQDKFKKLGCEILLGISRKSFIGKLLNIDAPIERDSATALIHALLAKKGIDIIRVHNVKLHRQLKILFEAIENAK